MKVKVIDELGQKRDASIDEVNRTETGLANEAKQLLLGAATEEREILRNAGLDSNIQEIENARGLNIERDRFEGTYGQKVFTTDEVRDICHKYALKMLPSKYYKGGIDPVLGAKVVEFFKKSNIDSRSYEASQNLYIMAPVNAFELKRKTDPFRVKLDPVMFYRIHRRDDRDNPMYVPIHQWGNDFTVLRRITGAVKFNFWTNAIFGTAVKVSILLMIAAIFGANFMDPIAFWWTLPLAFIWHFIYYVARYGGGDTEPIIGSRHKFSQHGWNREFK